MPMMDQPWCTRSMQNQTTSNTSSRRKWGIITYYQWCDGSQHKYIRWFYTERARDAAFEHATVRMAKSLTILGIEKVVRNETNSGV